VTNGPTPGWYADPELAGRLRYWDGAQWTEHIAAPQPITPPQAAPSPPPYAPYGVPRPAQATLFSNPYEKPARTKRRVLEESLTARQRVQAAAIDAALVIPFVIVGFGLGPFLGWISGNQESTHHAYHVVGIVVAVVLGLGVVGWNFLGRETTIGTDTVLSRQKQAS